MRSLVAIPLFLLAITIGLPMPIVWAYDEERAKNNFASELVECAAYFSIGSEGIKRSGNLEAASKSEATSNAALNAARQYSNDDIVLARFNLALEGQANLIDHDYANLSLLTAKYGDICKRAVENPHERFQYWKDKK